MKNTEKEIAIRRNLIRGTAGKWFKVSFVKKDGTVREMVARTGIKKGVTGKGMSYVPGDRGMEIVYDVQKKAHRLVNLDTMLSFSGKVGWKS